MIQDQALRVCHYGQGCRDHSVHAEKGPSLPTESGKWSCLGTSGPSSSLFYLRHVGQATPFSKLSASTAPERLPSQHPPWPVPNDLPSFSSSSSLGSWAPWPTVHARTLLDEATPSPQAEFCLSLFGTGYPWVPVHWQVVDT